MLKDEARQGIRQFDITQLNHGLYNVFRHYLNELATSLNLHEGTIYHAISYFAKYAALQQVESKDYPDLAYTAAEVALKTQELDENLPSFMDHMIVQGQSKWLQKLNPFSDINREQYESKEQQFLNTLEWELNSLNQSHFQEAFMVLGQVFQSDSFSQSLKQRSQGGSTVKCLRKGQRNLNKLVRVIMRASFMMPGTYEYRASQVAAANLYLARKMIGIEPAWRQELEEITSYAESDLVVLADYIFDNLYNLKLGEHTIDLTTMFPLLHKLPSQHIHKMKIQDVQTPPVDYQSQGKKLDFGLKVLIP